MRWKQRTPKSVNTEGDDIVMSIWRHIAARNGAGLGLTPLIEKQTDIAVMLEATVKELNYRDNVLSPIVMICEFHDLVNRRLSVNLSILEAVVYSSMIVSASDADYSLPKPWTKSGIGVMRMLLANRSLSAAMAYERHTDAISNPNNYLNKNRMDHPFDAILLPEALQNVS